MDTPFDYFIRDSVYFKVYKLKYLFGFRS